MSRQRSPDESERRDARPHDDGAGADHPAGEPARPAGTGGDVRRDRLDTIEWADDRTRALDPHHGGLDEAPMEDLLDGGETDAAYRKEARQVTPTIDPASERDDER
ncbi:hypothetical protein ACFWZ3_13240 [Frateuria sp. GZRR35]|uniref:hypothetical protein n=1 Tax=unclassified Frateuria TaxID=2648894 RepID=UPI003EDBF1AF